ncbi:MAG: hypothetical protein IKH57_16395 [Clostridia bacterium]|nr:hypothetical protein [Clostridia bacterium]
MEQTVHNMTHNGWSQEETDLLWKEVREAADSGAPLRAVFERMGESLGRKPNSVRNYYYMQLREQGGKDCKRAAAFETFSDEEIHDLLWHILAAKGQGQSVRASVMDLSNGDKTLMLRYQNKYRALLRKRPELIEQICQELKEAGQPCPDMTVTVQPLPQAVDTAYTSFQSADPDVQIILNSLSALARRAMKNDSAESDRLKVQRDLLMMRLEDLQLAVKAAVSECKDFLGYPPEERAHLLPAFCENMAQQIAKLEAVSG